jgi:hypothetical protein
MSAVAHITELETVEAPEALSAIAVAERKLADLFGYCDRLHRANIEHDPHSCVLCFEQR